MLDPTPPIARPLRVLLVSRPLRIGAYQRKAELIARDDRFALTVVVPARWREDGIDLPLDRAHTAGYELVALPVFLPGRFHLHAYRGLDDLIGRVRPDLVHIDEEAYNFAAYQALRAARGARPSGAARAYPRTLFFTWQNLRRRYPPPFSIFERAMFTQADGAIAGSKTSAAVLRSKGYAGPLWTIPQFGVDSGRFHPPTVPRQRDVGRLRIGYAGRLVPEKGLDVLIDAVSRIADRDPQATGDGIGRIGDRDPISEEGATVRIAARDPISENDAGGRIADRGSESAIATGESRSPGSATVTLGVPRPGITLELVGDGPERQKLEAQAVKLGLADRILFTPRLASTEMPAFYQRIDALVLPSRTTRSWAEQFGRVLIEAMACGAVCVGSDSGEIPHVIGPAGLVVPEGDAAALAEALQGLAHDPAERVRFAEVGRNRVLELFTMERIAEATTGVWGEILRL